MYKRKEINSQDKDRRYRKQPKARKFFAPYIMASGLTLLSTYFVFPTLFIEKTLIRFNISVSTILEELKVRFLFFTLTVIGIFFISGVLFRLFIKIPYRREEDTQFYVEKKIGIPVYRCFAIIDFPEKIDIESSNLKNINIIHQRFIDNLQVKIKKTSLVMHKKDKSINFYIILSSKSVFRKKLLKTIEEEVLFLLNCVQINYNYSPKMFLPNETTAFFKHLQKNKIVKRLNINRKALETNNFIDSIYETLATSNLKDIALFLKYITSEEDSISASLVAYSRNKTDILHLTRLSTLEKKKEGNFLAAKINIFENILKGKSHIKMPYQLLSNFFHVPLSHKGQIFFYEKSIQSNDSSKIYKTDKNDVVIGNIISNIDESKQFKLSYYDVLLNIEIYGMIGRGKTHLVLSIMNQLIENKIGLLVFDIKGEYASNFVKHQNVEVLTIGEGNPLCINVFDTKDEEDVRSTLLIIEEMMISSNQEFTPAMKNLFENALFLTHRSKTRNFESFINNIIEISNANRLKENTIYMQQTLDAVLNRLNYIFNPLNFEIFGVSESTINFSQLDIGKTIILDLSKYQKRAARPSDIYLLCNIILKMLYRHATLQGSVNSLRYGVILEEAINIIPNIYKVESSASIITSENNFLLGRSLGIGHITISQLWSSVSNIVHGNSSTKVIFRCSQDTDKIAKSINLTTDDLIQKLPSEHFYIFTDKLETPILLKSLPFSSNNLPYEEYLSILKKKHLNQNYPLLYESFLDMRGSLNRLTGVTTGSHYKSKPIQNEEKKQEKQIEAIDAFNYLKKVEKKDDSQYQINSTKYSFCENYCEEKQKLTCERTRFKARFIAKNLIRELGIDYVEQVIKDTINYQKVFSEISRKLNLKSSKVIMLCTLYEIRNILVEEKYIQELDKV